MRFRAKFVLPVCSPPIENGFVDVERGRIIDVGRQRGPANDRETDFGDAAILPGFVNAHTHLELSHLAGTIPTEGHLTDWLARLVAELRRDDDRAATAEKAVAIGARMSVESGVTTVGDITSAPGRTRPVLMRSPLRGVSFGEVIAIGTLRDRASDQIDAALEPTPAEAKIAAGISPHAPYTVEPAVLAECAVRARSEHARVCIHALETPDEVEFTQSATGALAEYLRELGTWDKRIVGSGASPIELLDQCGLLAENVLLAHANYATTGDIELLAKRRASVAFCPRTHAAFRHDTHPFRDMLRAGVNVCIGTDSLASNPSLSILEELRFIAAAYAEVTPSQLIEMGTRSGAIALGLRNDVGTIEPGRQADFAVVAVDAGTRDPAEAALRDNGSVRATVIGGETVYETP